jgi:hypothetical protein
MKKRNKKRKRKKARNLVILGMILTRHGGPMKDRREPRGGDRNEQRELLEVHIEHGDGTIDT